MKIHDYALQHGNRSAALAFIIHNVNKRTGVNFYELKNIEKTDNWLSRMELLVAKGIDEAQMPRLSMVSIIDEIVEAIKKNELT